MALVALVFPFGRSGKSLLPLLSLLSLSTLNPQFTTVFAQGSAFSYQGRLNDHTNPANGIYDLRFTVYDSANTPGNLIAGPMTNAATRVASGLFSVTLDFGAGVFTGRGRWLKVADGQTGAVRSRRWHRARRFCRRPTPSWRTAPATCSVRCGRATGRHIARGSVAKLRPDE